MKQGDINLKELPKAPGVYIFKDGEGVVLYVGRASNLQSRVQSYFSKHLGSNRGQRLVDALEKTEHVKITKTDSVLEAYILEAKLIKELQPTHNVVDKDNKSFQYIGITKEAFPRVLVVRKRQMEQEATGTSFSCTYGPFPKGAMLKKALHVLRKILPYRDTCTPQQQTAKETLLRKCFQAQTGLCPGVCAGLVDKKKYAKRIREIHLFLSGKKVQLITGLKKEMNDLAKSQEFEKAEEIRRRIVALQHIQDVSLIRQEDTEMAEVSAFRIEAYDTAHTAGRQAVGVMVVLIDGERAPSEYRVFSIKNAKERDDIGALREILKRRFNHPEWRFPKLLVVDGGKAHRAVAEKVLNGLGLQIPVVSVVKTENHAPREILGHSSHVQKNEKNIIFANTEAHRFAITRHRQKRSKDLFK